MPEPHQIRADAIEAAATAALRTLELCQAARTLNKAGVVSGIQGAILGAAHAATETQAHLSIVAETL